jgi:hypothetical protein
MKMKMKGKREPINKEHVTSGAPTRHGIQACSITQAEVASLTARRLS